MNFLFFPKENKKVTVRNRIEKAQGLILSATAAPMITGRNQPSVPLVSKLVIISDYDTKVLARA